MDLNGDFHGVPIYGWFAGGAAVVTGGYIFYKRRKAKTVPSTAATTSTTGIPTGDMTSPLPGGGILAPITINPVSDPGTNTPAGPTNAGVEGPIKQFAYGTQLQELINQNGALVHRWTDVAGHWASEVLLPAGTLAPGAEVSVTQNEFGQANRIDYSAPNAAGGESHGWYTPQQKGWGKETLPGVTGVGTVVAAGTP